MSDVNAEVNEELAARFRRAAGRYATGLGLVTTVTGGQDHAMTANSFTSVSLDPLLALVCVERDSRFHEAVLEAGFWSVSFLPTGAGTTARWFATRGRPLDGQFDRYDHERGRNGAVLLSHRLAALELTTTQVVRAGDHDILIAAVDVIHDPAATPQMAAGAAGPPESALPTVYFASRFHALAPEPTAAAGGPNSA